MVAVIVRVALAPTRKRGRSALRAGDLADEQLDDHELVVTDCDRPARVPGRCESSRRPARPGRFEWQIEWQTPLAGACHAPADARLGSRPGWSAA